jgi:hypothetical protein
MGGGCSITGNEPDTQIVSTANTRAPSVLEAKQAIRQSSRFNVATGRARSVEGCTSNDRSTTCAVDYDSTCDVLSVTRTAGVLVVARPTDEQVGCVHSSGWLKLGP